MKARLLKKLLNNTEYSISNNEKYIAVGSPLCHNLISVDKETLKLKYALDTWREGRKSLEAKSNSKGENELLFIWDKLQDLIESGEILDIINGKDQIENPLPVFTVEDGRLEESVTDKYGWPNTDDNGVCMYENTHFPTREPAIEYGLREYRAGIKMVNDRIADLKEKLESLNAELKLYHDYVDHLEGIR